MSEEIGLNEKVRDAAESALGALFPKWMGTEPRDFQRILKSVGSGSYTIGVGRYRGSHSCVSFMSSLEEHAEFRNLRDTILRYQPELLSYILLPQYTSVIQDQGLVVHWCRSVEKRIEEGITPGVAISNLLNDLDGALTSRELHFEVCSPLSGLQMPPGQERIDLDSKVTIRALSRNELSMLGSHDLVHGRHYDIASSWISAACFLEDKFPLDLMHDCTSKPLQLELQQDVRQTLSRVQTAIHVLKKGKVGIVASHFSLSPNVLPGLGRSESGHQGKTQLGILKLEESEIEELQQIYLQLSSSQLNGNVKIGAKRLSDAELRDEAVDSLLDSAIGLEAILKPHSHGEMNFRMALNYAFMGPKGNREARYGEISGIHKFRNKIAHGGGLSEGDSAELFKQKAIASDCLRDAIKSFLFDPDFCAPNKVDAGFWLNRIISDSHEPGNGEASD